MHGRNTQFSLCVSLSLCGYWTHQESPFITLSTFLVIGSLPEHEAQLFGQAGKRESCWGPTCLHQSSQWYGDGHTWPYPAFTFMLEVLSQVFLFSLQVPLPTEPSPKPISLFFSVTICLGVKRNHKESYSVARSCLLVHPGCPERK